MEEWTTRWTDKPKAIICPPNVFEVGGIKLKTLISPVYVKTEVSDQFCACKSFDQTCIFEVCSILCMQKIPDQSWACEKWRPSLTRPNSMYVKTLTSRYVKKWKPWPALCTWNVKALISPIYVKLMPWPDQPCVCDDNILTRPVYVKVAGCQPSFDKKYREK